MFQGMSDDLSFLPLSAYISFIIHEALWKSTSSRNSLLGDIFGFLHELSIQKCGKYDKVLGFITKIWIFVFVLDDIND